MPRHQPIGRPLVRTILSIIMICLSLWVLETARAGVDITRDTIGTTPITTYAQPDSTGPVVVIAHGFAGSEQMMQGYALPLARAGYRVTAFEFLGHGRHPAPMSGDVTRIDGTTRLLVEQTQSVIDAVATDEPVALLGHSMATDVLVRAAQDRDDIGPIVLISAFSQVIDDDHPKDLLLISGAWEGGLRAFADSAAKMVDPDAAEEETVTNGDTIRRAVAAPYSEHVSVLHSRTGRNEAVAWLNRAYDRDVTVTLLPSGWAILGLLGGLVLLFPSLAARLPQAQLPDLSLSVKRRAIVHLLPLLITPFIAVPLTPSFIPVLVADYLMVHLLVFGALQLGLLWWWGTRTGGLMISGLLLLLGWSILFGIGLDRYAANFWPTSQRVWIIAIMLLGTLPYMLADALLTTQAGWLARLAARGSFLVSLLIAVALDFEALFFLIMIAPVLILFYMVFGSMGRAAARRSGPLASAIALGVVLAWALGVSFPLFQA